MTALPPTLGIRHLALFVADLPAAEAFYCGVLGYQVEWRPDADNLYLTMGGQDNLAIHKGKAAPGETRLDHFDIILKKAADVDAWHEHLAAKGVKIVKAPKTHRDGARSFYCQDPEGNTIQFIHHPPISDRV
jgi:catechol 2,3-dioxygenase-like lactoylglutathione lyase family enzyme